MTTISNLAGACALLALAIPAQAGPCSDAIAGLTKTLSAKDAGSGPTDNERSGTTGSISGQHAQHPPTATMNQATQGTATSGQDVQRQTQGQPTAAEQAQSSAPRAQHPPTATMNQATQGGAASAQDVQRQTQGAPTAADQAQGGSGMARGDQAGASAALARARSLDGEGKEAECMQAVQEAKRLSGS